MSAQANSVTLIPKIGKISEQECIIDSAGFEDQRNYVGVFMVHEAAKVLL